MKTMMTTRISIAMYPSRVVSFYTIRFLVLDHPDE